MAIFQENRIDAVVNLAARAGVRYSIENPFVYMTTNAYGTLNLLELMRKHGVKKIVLASTSSLYAGQKMPFSEELPVNTPISPYAASKKAAEVMVYSYHYLFGIDASVVRYFTVYGPAGRPDMSMFRFIKWIDEGDELVLYGDGSQSRDFTFVSDIAEGTIRALKPVGFEIVNLGNSHPHELSEMISLIEHYLGKKARIRQAPFQKTDMMATWADIGKAKRLFDWAAGNPALRRDRKDRRLVPEEQGVGAGHPDRYEQVRGASCPGCLDCRFFLRAPSRVPLDIIQNP